MLVYHQPILECGANFELILYQLLPKPNSYLPTLGSASKCQMVGLKALKRNTFHLKKYSLSKYFKREYLKQTSVQSMVVLVRGLQALGRRFSAIPESNISIKSLFQLIAFKYLSAKRIHKVLNIIFRNLHTEGSQLRELVEDSAEIVRFPLCVRVICDVVS